MSLDFYRQHSASTNPGAHVDLLNNLPTDLPGLHEVGRNVMIHIWKIRKFHPHLVDQRNILMYRMEDMLAEIRKRDDRPLTEDRPVEQKLIVDCRHFAGFLSALLRHQGVPARVRCGFGVYLEPENNVAQDHYATEYWNGERWVLEDSDVVMHDVARDQFVIAGQAWRDGHAGKVDPQFFACGPFWRGYSIIGFNLTKDLALLNKREELSLGSWGLMRGMEGQWSDDESALLDNAAKHTLANNDGFDAMRAFYESQDRLRVPEKVLVCDYELDAFSERVSI